MLDNRLSLCAEFVTGDYFCDIGTDHAYLPAELVLSGKCRRGIASDINKKPLAAAAATLEKFGVSERVKLVISDGMKNIDMNGVTDVIIAGMGGDLICDIVEEGFLSGKLTEDMSLILQPMTRASEVRGFLCCNGFTVVSERAACVGKFCYSVMRMKYTGDYYACTPLEEEIGFMDFSRENERKYALSRLERLEKIIGGMKRSSDAGEELREYEELAEEIRKKLSREVQS